MIDGKGWALVLRADGTKTTFTYDSTHWTTSSTLNVTGHATGTSDAITEYKSPLFNVYGYSELRLGMRIAGTTNWLEVKHGRYANMQTVMNGGVVTFNGTTRNDWLALANNGALQPLCNQIGYNYAPPNVYSGAFHVRIGLMGNNENECLSPDSCLGFGICLSSFRHLFELIFLAPYGAVTFASVGNIGRYPDHFRADGSTVAEIFATQAFGYVLIR
jgi:hypothetical protein